MLAVIRLIYFLISNYLDKKGKNNDLYMTGIIVFLSFIGYILGLEKIWLPFSFDIALFSLGFYHFGYMINKYELIDKINFKILILLIVFWILGIKYSWIELAVRRYPIYSYLVSCVGSIVVIYICKFISKLKVSNFLKYCGVNSFYILAAHSVDWMIMNIFNIEICTNCSPTIYKLEFSIIRIIISIIFAYVICKINLLFKKTFKREKYIV